MGIRTKFSEPDLERIRSAVKAAEARISGEIIPVIVSKSNHYSIAYYRSGMFCALSTFLLLVIFNRYVPDLAIDDLLLIFLVVVLLGVLGSMIPYVSNDIRRLFISHSHMDHATRQRASSAFLEQEVFNTRHRTGIMIFVSLFENEVIVMGDRGISKVVEQKVWDNVVRNLNEHVRTGTLVEGLEIAIKTCGDILFDKGFKKTSDDINELRDDLRVD